MPFAYNRLICLLRIVSSKKQGCSLEELNFLRNLTLIICLTTQSSAELYRGDNNKKYQTESIKIWALIFTSIMRN